MPPRRKIEILEDSPALARRVAEWMTATALAVSHSRPELRITLTLPAIESRRHIAFLVEGKSKPPILATIRAGESRLAAAQVRPTGEPSGSWIGPRQRPASDAR